MPCYWGGRLPDGCVIYHIYNDCDFSFLQCEAADVKPFKDLRMQVADIGRAMELGREAAEAVSATFVKPIHLEFEKVVSAPGMTGDLLNAIFTPHRFTVVR